MHGARKRRACGSPARSDLDLVKYAGAEMYLSNVHGDTKLTNTQNGKSVTLQLAEASHDEFFPDGSSHLQVSGATIIWAQPPDFVELTLLNGQRAMYFDAGGNLISDVVRGSRTNLCDVLAG